MTEQQIREALKWDTPYLARNCLRIVNKRTQTVMLEPNRMQLRLDTALERQRQEGRPMRAIVLKARKLGFSTWVQAKLIQRATQHANQRALVVAHDGKTAGELFGIGRHMYVQLPQEIKPALAGFSDSARSMKYLKFGERSRRALEAGRMGLNSQYAVDTAQEVEAGRGFTFSTVHLSEVAFWPDEGKLTAILNAVPLEPETLVVLESTANGENFFKRRWDEAWEGRESPDGSMYVPIFAAWHEDPSATLPFRDDEHRHEFEETVYGRGEWGEDEPRYVEEFGCTMEQLHWRRIMIRDQCESKLDKWKQEYPSSPEEAFLASSKHVFSVRLLQRVAQRTDKTDPRVTTDSEPGPARGILTGASWHTKPTVQGSIEIPRKAVWTPKDATGFPERHPWWRVWLPPVNEETEEGKPPDERRPTSAHVVAVDAAQGEETTEGDRDYHAIQVVNHRTLKQCAEYRSRIDPDLLALEALFAALYFNQAWVMVEVTGGYGLPIAQALVKKYRYPRVYMRRTPESRREKPQDRLGWDTNVKTKKMLISLGAELLRGTDDDEETDGIHSRQLAAELLTFVYDDRMRAGASPSAHDDLVMAWLIAQMGAQMLPVAVGSSLQGPVDTSTRPVGSQASGY